MVVFINSLTSTSSFVMILAQRNSACDIIKLTMISLFMMPLCLKFGRWYSSLELAEHIFMIENQDSS